MSSTFQFFPGMVILHSKDLVNWQMIGHAVDDVTQISRKMNRDRMARYSESAYSLDGTTFIPFGKPYQLTWGAYRGDRIGLVNYNHRSDDGWADVDWFHYEYPLPSTARVNPEVEQSANTALESEVQP